MNDYWTRQTDTPLFDASWAKPERKSQAGKLLVIGGVSDEFSRVQESYALAVTYGIGACKAILPQSLKTTLGQLPDIEYAQSHAHGGFSLDSEDELLDYCAWADTVLFPGEIGRNSETTQVLTHILQKISARCVITRDAFDVLVADAKPFVEREKTSLVLSFAQLQQLLHRIEWPVAALSTMPLTELVALLHELTTKYPISIVVYFEQNLIGAWSGSVVTTRLNSKPERWRLQLSTCLAVWQTWLDEEKGLESIMQASWEFKTSQIPA